MRIRNYTKNFVWCLQIITLTPVGLKLCDFITLSWWWALSPILILTGAMILVIFLMIAKAIILNFIESFK